jgi:hypothetical protein
MLQINMQFQEDFEGANDNMNLKMLKFWQIFSTPKQRCEVRICFATQGDHWAKIVEQRAIKNRVQYIHCR